MNHLGLGRVRKVEGLERIGRGIHSTEICLGLNLISLTHCKRRLLAMSSMGFSFETCEILVLKHWMVFFFPFF